MSNWKTVENDETVIRSCCWSPPGCHPVGCGAKLHIKDGVLVKVEGDPEHPISRGALCPRGLAITEYMYHPDRILYPIKRDPKNRGLDKWERISWDDALDLIETRTKEIIAQYGPESILVFGGTGREGNNYYMNIANVVFGTPNACYAQAGWSCYAPRMAVTAFLCAVGYPEIDYACRYPDRYDHPGWTAPEYIILWGKEPLKSNPDGFWGHAIIDMMRECGTKIICVDPRITWLGTRADMVLQLRPGTDAALALSMLNVIINEDLYDHDFVDKWTYGFDELTERVQEYPPSKAAEICWLREEDIISAARKFASGGNSSIGWGLAVDQSRNGLQIAQALIAMLAITDNIDVPGGVTLGTKNFSDTISSSDKTAIDNGIMTEETWEKRIGNVERPAVNAVMATAGPDCTLDTLETDIPYPLRMAYFHCSNVIGPAITAAPQRWHKALKEKMEFCFATETFHNPTTMALCDLVLPLSAWTEHDSVIFSHYGLNIAFQGAINKVVQVGECKSDIEQLLLIGKRLHPDYWDQFADEVDYLNKRWVRWGHDFESLREAVVIQKEEPYRKYELGLLRPDGQPGFMTPSGRVELFSNVYDSFGDDALPYYVEPYFSPVSTPEVYQEYPLILTTGARTYASFHSEHRQVPSLREIVPDPVVELHPDTAASLGIIENDWCWIENQFGKVKQRAHLTETIDPRVTHAMHGWWFPEQDGEEPSLFGNWQSNINMIMPHKMNGTLGYGNTFKSILCKVYKAN